MWDAIDAMTDGASRRDAMWDATRDAMWDGAFPLRTLRLSIAPVKRGRNVSYHVPYNSTVLLVRSCFLTVPFRSVLDFALFYSFLPPQKITGSNYQLK